MNKISFWTLVVIGVLLGLFLSPIMQKSKPSHEVVIVETIPEASLVVPVGSEISTSTNNDQPSVKFKSHYGIDIPQETKTGILAKYDELKTDFPYGDYWVEVSRTINDDALNINVIDLNTFTSKALQASESKFYYDLDSLNMDETYGDFSYGNEEKIRDIVGDTSVGLPFDFIICRELKCMFILNKSDTMEVDIVGMHSQFKSIRGGQSKCSTSQSLNDGNKLMITVTCET